MNTSTVCKDTEHVYNNYNYCSKCGWSKQAIQSFTMTKEEVEALLKVLEHEFISYEAELAHTVLRRMQIFLKEQKENNELA